jgi:hypothetical protein
MRAIASRSFVTIEQLQASCKALDSKQRVLLVSKLLSVLATDSRHAKRVQGWTYGILELIATAITGDQSMVCVVTRHSRFVRQCILSPVWY